MHINDIYIKQKKIKNICDSKKIKRKYIISPLYKFVLDRLSESSAASWRSIPVYALRVRTRSTLPISTARHAAIYFSHIVFSSSLSHAGRIFGRDRTTARHACLRIEVWRDDPSIDRAFDALEPALRLWADAFMPVAKEETRKNNK